MGHGQMYGALFFYETNPLNCKIIAVLSVKAAYGTGYLVLGGTVVTTIALVLL
jgi:hypothetical protein